MNCRVKAIIDTLVDVRLAEKFWDPELHPRVSAGTTKGGEFTFKGTDTTDISPVEPVMGGPEGPPDPTVALSTHGYTVKLDPKTLDVGGDNWNRHVARRLEYEYKRTKPDLDKLVDKIVGSKAEKVPFDKVYDFDDDEDAHYTPESWDEMPNDMQETAEEKWKSDSYNEFYESEVNNWYENGHAYDTAASNLVDEFDDKKNTTEPPDWASDVIDNAIGVYEDSGKPIPYTKEQLLKAISVEYSKSGYGGSSDPDIEFDDDELGNPKGWVDNPTLPGIEPQKPEDFLTADMREDLEKALTKAFVKQAEHDQSNVDAPDYLKDSVEEYQGEHWNQMEDEQKFKWAKNNTDLLDDDTSSSYSKPEPEIVDIKRPDKIDPLGNDSKHGSNSNDYKMTQVLARKMSIKRAKEIFKQRNIETKGSAESAARAIDNTIWSSWKGSSTSVNGMILQMAIAEELHGRLNYKQLGVISSTDIAYLRKRADSDFDGGYEGIKAYLRAKWETTQWLLDNAGMQTLDLYRGLKNIDQGSKQTMTDKRGNAYNHLPELNLERNGAASTSVNRNIANNWGTTVMRMKVPRTSVLSVPVYGQNVYGEQETVVTGTAFKGWDTFASPAPSIDDISLMKAAKD